MVRKVFTMMLLGLICGVVLVIHQWGEGITDDGLNVYYSWHSSTDLNVVDQYLWVGNLRSDAAVPRLSITPKDANGKPLTDLLVEGLFGSLKGELLIPPGGGGEILRFTGKSAPLVRKVTVRVESVRWLHYAHPKTKELTIQPLAADDSPVTRFDDFSSVVVSNPNDFEVRAGIDYIVWRDPSEVPQQARLVARFPSPIVVPANGSVKVDIGHDVRSKMMARGDPETTAVSIKSFLVP